MNLEEWLNKADNLMAELRRDLVQETNPNYQTALRRRIDLLSEDITRYENKWITQQSDNDTTKKVYLYLQRGSQQAAVGNYDLALESYKQALEVGKNQPAVQARVYLERAETYAQINQWQNSLADYTAIERLDKEYQTTRRFLGRGSAYFFLERLEEAGRDFQKALKNAQERDDTSSELEALHFLGVIALRQEKPDLNAARNYFEQAANLGEKHSDRATLAHIYVKLGDLYRQQRQTEAAHKNYQRAKELNPNNPDTYEGLGLISRNLGELDEAEALLRRALELEPERTAFLINLATLLLRRRQHNEAKKLYEQALELGGTGAALYNGLGTCYIALGKLADAEGAFWEAVKLNPASGAGWGNLGAVLLAQDQPGAAEDAYRKAAQLGGNALVETAWYNLLANKPISTELQDKFEQEENRQGYEVAEFESAKLLLETTLQDLATRQRTLNTTRQKAKYETDPLNRFYWQNCVKLLEQLVRDAQEKVGQAAAIQSSVQPAKSTPKVFLAYSSVDLEIVQNLHERLKRDGAQLWFAEVDLLPGHNKRLETQKAMEAANFILICISSKSVAQPGRLQRELKQALELAEEQPEGQIFSITVRLDDCPVPLSLSEITPMNYFKSGDYERLLQALGLSAQDSASAANSAVNQTQRNEVQPLPNPPKTIEPQITSAKLSRQEIQRLIRILSNADDFLANPRSFLITGVGIPRDYVMSMSLSSDNPIALASTVVDKLEHYGPLPDQPDTSALKALIERLLGAGLGATDLDFLYSLKITL
jgi:tetratricopeptide (TPR) repeat protein